MSTTRIVKKVRVLLSKLDSMTTKRYTIERLVYKVERSTIQGGFSNDEYPIEYLRDFRKVHHFPSLAAKRWKKLHLEMNDSKYYDGIGEDGCKAEGKRYTEKDGVSFVPSRDTGADRKFNPENLEECFKTNSFYFLYTVADITDEHVVFHILWIPITTIREWYETYGNKKGCITATKWRQCLSLCDFVQTEETRG